MRLEVDGTGYETAAEAFVGGNQLAALWFDRLTGQLAGLGGMAGDDSTSQEFATAYDESAREAVAALADLVGSFTGLGHLTHAALTNHVRAEVRSVAAGSAVYDGGVLPDVGDDRGYVVVLPSTPPTSLGATEPGLPWKVGWILDHLEGFVWPGADVDRLRSAAAAWRAAADGLVGLETHCDSAMRGFWRERSPEIPLAIDATHELRSTVRDLSAQYAALAAACEQYADQVEAKHQEILDAAMWVLEQIVEGVAISVALGVLTGGAGTAAGLSAVAAKVAAESPRFVAIVEALRAFTASIASTVRVSREGLKAARASLTKFKDAAAARSAARGEAGTLRLWWEREAGWLSRHEHSGSHTIQRHVGKTDEELLQRLARDSRPEFASTFSSQDSAEHAISRVLELKRQAIREWLDHGGSRRRLDATLDFVTGRSASRTGDVFEVTGLRVLLVRDASMPDGYRILTSFPQP
ncbi:RNase A-like domain-containing protein [Nocardioides sp. MAHUQ-72]|uniref:RNase A-like domain-containing protein n=1 Tax=unclassified Nocardioides TaxID=2615069 RepID=UPI0036233E10